MKLARFFLATLFMALVISSVALADSLEVKEKFATSSSAIVGVYPEISGMDELNSKLRVHAAFMITEMSRYSSSQLSQGSSKILGYTIEYNDGYAKLDLIFNDPIGINFVYKYPRTYYIDTTDKTLVDEDTYLAAIEPEVVEEDIPVEEEEDDYFESIYYYRLRDVSDPLGYELVYTPPTTDAPSSVDIFYPIDDELFYIATIFNGTSLVVVEDALYDIIYPVEHIDDYFYIPSSFAEWLEDILL